MSENEKFYKLCTVYDILGHLILCAIFFIGCLNFNGISLFISLFGLMLIGSYFISVSEFLSGCCDSEPDNKRLDSFKLISRIVNYITYITFWGFLASIIIGTYNV